MKVAPSVSFFAASVAFIAFSAFAFSISDCADLKIEGASNDLADSPSLIIVTEFITSSCAIEFTTSIPSTTCPKTVCFPSNQGVSL